MAEAARLRQSLAEAEERHRLDLATHNFEARRAADALRATLAMNERERASLSVRLGDLEVETDASSKRAAAAWAELDQTRAEWLADLAARDATHREEMRREAEALAASQAQAAVEREQLRGTLQQETGAAALLKEELSDAERRSEALLEQARQAVDAAEAASAARVSQAGREWAERLRQLEEDIERERMPRAGEIEGAAHAARAAQLERELEAQARRNG